MKFVAESLYHTGPDGNWLHVMAPASVSSNVHLKNFVGKHCTQLKKFNVNTALRWIHTREHWPAEKPSRGNPIQLREVCDWPVYRAMHV